MTFRLPGSTGSVALLLGVTAFLPHAALSAQDTARIVAIGDIHGGSDELAGILQQDGLLDNQYRWSGGSTILVQTGDMTESWRQRPCGHGPAHDPGGAD